MQTSRFKASGINSEFASEPEFPFAEYIRNARLMIETARMDIRQDNRETILEANSPFELQPDPSVSPKSKRGKFENGILLIHGLSDSPYLMKPIARHLQSRGFLVRAILLPGHGTVPGDLLNVTWGAWIKAVAYGVRRLRPHVEKLYMGGLSTGGALSVWHALKTATDIHGLILFSPAFRTRSRIARLSGYIRHFRKWVHTHADLSYAKYESFAFNAAHQLSHITQDIRKMFLSGKKLAMPVFVASSMDDKTIDTHTTLDIFKTRMSSEKRRFILYTTNSSSRSQHTHHAIVPENSVFPEEHILDFSHVCIPLPPDDPHYGRDRDYAYLYYENGKLRRMTEKQQIRLNGAKIWQGEDTKENLKKRIFRRLTYNPAYDRMIGQLDDFLEGAM